MKRGEILAALESLIRVIDANATLPDARRGSVMKHARAVVDRARRGFLSPLPWTPFEAASPVPATDSQVAMMRELMPSLTPGDAREILRSEVEETRLFVNSLYQVAMREDGDTVHLSIKRIDQTAVHDWRDLQRIKDELVGPECEAVELYPSQSRLVDTANQYHLWCIRDPAYRFPFGFDTGLVADTVSGGANQRPREP